MTTRNDELSALGYTSSISELDILVEDDVVKPEDLDNLNTMQQVARLLKERQKHYQSISSLAYGENITVENQLIINHQMRHHIQELQSLIESTVTKAKEQLNGRR